MRGVGGIVVSAAAADPLQAAQRGGYDELGRRTAVRRYGRDRKEQRGRSK